MTARTFTRTMASIAGAAVLLAACQGATNTTAPATVAPVTAAPVTQAPATAAPIGTSGPGLTFDTSSFHADVELEELFPDTIGGEEMHPLSMDGPSMMAQGGSPEMAATLTALGKTPDDLSAAFGFAGDISIVAFQVEGVPGSTILNALFTAFQQVNQSTITDATIGGKPVKQITPKDPDDDAGYVYAARDVVFLVSGDNLANLNEAVSKLP